MEFNKYKFNHCSVPSHHVMLQTNNINLLLRLTNELRTIFFLLVEFVLVIKTRCFREAYTGLAVVRVTENQKALNCVVLKYSIPVSEE